MIKHGANLCQIFPALAVNSRGRPLIIISCLMWMFKISLLEMCWLKLNINVTL